MLEERRRNDFTKMLSLGIIFACLSVLMVSSFNWKYDFGADMWTVRIWQYLLAFFSGGALGVSGLLLQKLTRNSLADVSILGIGSLNIIFIVGYILARYDGTVDGLATVKAHLPLISVGSSILGTAIIYTISKDRPDNCEKFTIIGISLQFIFEGISVILSNQESVKKMVSEDVAESMNQINTEIQNYAYGRFPNVLQLSKSPVWRATTVASVILIVLITGLVYRCRREMDLMEFSEELAKFYGIRIKFLKGFLYMCVALLVGIESAMIGTISLLGIVAASFSRLLFGNGSRVNIVTSFFIGGLLVLLAAFISINLNKNIPIGFLSTSIIAPIFLYLLFKRK